MGTGVFVQRVDPRVDSRVSTARRRPSAGYQCIGGNHRHLGSPHDGADLKKESASDVFHQLIPWITAGFLMMIVTGMLLLWSEPVKCYNSIWFRLKVLFLFLAGINVLVFHSSKIYRNMHEWEWAENPPRAAKLAGWISLISWGIVIIAGRTTAYNF